MYYVTKHVVPPEHVAAWAWIIGWRVVGYMMSWLCETNHAENGAKNDPVASICEMQPTVRVIISEHLP